MTKEAGMTKETVARRLARLRSGPEYDLALELRYQAPEEKAATISETPEPTLVEALRLEEPDYGREYDWIVGCNKRGVIPAIKVGGRQGSEVYRLYVYPQNGRRYTVAAWVEFKARMARCDGLVATGSRTNSEAAEELLRDMVDIALRDATPERFDKALSTSPQDWLHEMKGQGGEWLSIVSDNLNEGLVRQAWLDCKFAGLHTISTHDLEVYGAYLAGTGAKIVPRTSASEHIYRYSQELHVEYQSYCRRNQFRLPIAAPELKGHFAGDSWEGWDDFHSRWPEAPGLLSLSAVGYCDNKERAFFTVFSRCDPRLLESSNARSGTLEFLERVWVENTPSGWRVQDKVTLHARPLDVGPKGSICWAGSVTPEFTGDSLRDGLRIRVRYESPIEFQVGFCQQQPVAFFTINGTSWSNAVAGIVGGSEARSFTPPETRPSQTLEFELDESRLALGEGLLLDENLEHEPVIVTAFVWIDGDWRSGSATLEPDEPLSETLDWAPVEHHPLVLDCLYRSLERGRES